MNTLLIYLSRFLGFRRLDGCRPPWNHRLISIPMDTSPLLRQQVSESLAAHQTEKISDGAIALWERMASQIISIVGEDGFNSLYARSVYLTQPDFPWLGASLRTSHVVPRFAELKKILARRAPEQASKANEMLMHTFTSILASLIGDELTIRILRSAWGDDACNGRQGVQNE